MQPTMPIRKGAFVLPNRYNRGEWWLRLSARWRRVAVYRFNVAVNNLLGKYIRREDGGIHCWLVSLQCRRTSLVHDKVADETG